MGLAAISEVGHGMSEGAFEAKVERRSENAKGIFITLLVNPADHDEALSQVRVGSALQIGWAEIVDTSVQPMEPEPTFSEAIRAASAEVREEMAPLRAALKQEATKPKQAFKDMSLTAQAGIRCNDPRFVEFLRTKWPRALAAGDTPADIVRDLCGVKSRTELSENHQAANVWRKLNSDFESWTLTQKYEGANR